MTKNAEEFLKYFEEEFGKKLDPEPDDKEGNTSIWMYTEDDDTDARIMLTFTNNDTMVHMYSSNSKLEIPDKSVDGALKILNKYNSDYAVTKFVCEGNSVCVESFLPFHDNFSPVVVTCTLFHMIDLTEELCDTLDKAGLLN